MPTLRDRKNLPYIEASLLELLRYTAVAPIAVPHQTVTDTTLGGHPIPKNTEVSVTISKDILLYHLILIVYF